MIKLILILASLFIMGCNQGDKMATIGEEVNGELVSTNVTDDTQVYDSTAIYSDGEIVQQGDYLWSVINKNINSVDAFNDTSELYLEKDEVSFESHIYKATALMRQGLHGTLTSDECDVTDDTMWETFGDPWPVEFIPAPSHYRGSTSCCSLLLTKQFSVEDSIGTDNGDGSFDVSVEVTVTTYTSATCKTEDTTTTTTEIWTRWEELANVIVGDYYMVEEGDFLEVFKKLRTTLNNPDNSNMWELSDHDIVRLGATNPYRPFDGSNITPAIFPSPMQYVVEGLEEFNSFTLAKVLASELTYTFTLPVGDANYDLWLDGVEVSSGGNGITKTATVAIDCKRDPTGLLSLSPTTIILYADIQMPIASAVTIELTHTDDIELGDFTLNNAVCSTFTRLNFFHGMQDFNDYTPDAWGNIPEKTKAIVTKFTISCDLYLDKYDYGIAFLESIKGKFVSIDGSDSGGETPDGETKFGSLTRRGMITSATPSTIVKDGDLYYMANVKLTVQEVV